MTAISAFLQSLMTYTFLPSLMLVAVFRYLQMYSCPGEQEWKGTWQHANNILWSMNTTAIVYGFWSLPLIFLEKPFEQTDQALYQLLAWMLVLFSTLVAEVLGETPFAKERRGIPQHYSFTYFAETAMAVTNSLAAVTAMVLIFLLLEPTYIEIVRAVGLTVAAVTAVPLLYWAASVVREIINELLGRFDNPPPPLSEADLLE